MSLVQPNLLPRPFAESGTAAVIPDVKVNFGEASWQEGFPTETGLPLTAGGIPPRKMDMNGVLKMLSEHICFLQAGGVYDWINTLDYRKNAHVCGTDGVEYVALVDNGPNTGVGAQDPVTCVPGIWEPAATGSTQPGFADYIIPVIETDGEVEIVLANIGHPPMTTGYNPIINLLTDYPYNFVIKDISLTKFTVQIYQPNGTPGIHDNSPMQFGDGSVFGGSSFGGGTGSGGSDACTLLISIPLPA